MIYKNIDELREVLQKQDRHMVVYGNFDFNKFKEFVKGKGGKVWYLSDRRYYQNIEYDMNDPALYFSFEDEISNYNYLNNEFNGDGCFYFITAKGIEPYTFMLPNSGVCNFVDIRNFNIVHTKPPYIFKSIDLTPESVKERIYGV